MDLELARHQPILDVATSLGLAMKKKGSCYQDDAMHITVYPRTNSYYNFYEHRGGSPIDLLIHEMEMSFQEAVDYLLTFSGEPVTRMQEELPRRNEPFTLPEPAADNANVFYYLTKIRRLSPDIVEELIKRHFIYEEKQYHNCVFVGMDYEGVPRHAFLHGTIEGNAFKGDAQSSDKRFGFTLVREGSDTLTVFEAPIDLISYASLCDDFPTHMMALGMLSMEPADLFLSEHPEVKKIRLLLDRDIWGKQAAERFMIQYSSRGYDIKDDALSADLDAANVKDVNEYLKEMERKKDEQRR